MWRGKVLAQVVKSTWLGERSWVQVLCMPIMCYLIIIVLIIWMCGLSKNIVFELC